MSLLKTLRMRKKNSPLKKGKSIHIIQACKEIRHEDPKDYKVGGYHPVKIGDYLDEDNYIVVGKLGWGHFSTVWLCYDFEYKDFVAVKVVKSAKHYTEAALDEIKLCADCQGCQGCVQLYDHFMVRGPHGRHVCLVFELVGENLLSLIRKYQDQHIAIPMELTKQIVRDMLIGLVEMKSKKLIHTDLKPENVLLRELPKRVKELIENFEPPPENERPKRKKKRREKFSRTKVHTLNLRGSQYHDSIVCKLADFGNACWTDRHFTDDIQTRQYRAPEILLGQDYDTSTDIWSFAALCFELITFDYLFNPKGGKHYSKNEDHIAQMIELLGPIDPRIKSKGKHSKRYFSKSGSLLHIKRLKYWDLKSVLIEKYGMEIKDANLVGDFLLHCLQFDPRKRSFPEHLINHDWISYTENERHDRNYFNELLKDIN